MISFHVDWISALGILLGVVLPLAVSIVTKLTTPAWEKAVLLAGLSLVTNILTQLDHALIHHTAFDLGNALILGLGTFIVAVSSALGLWDPTRVTRYLTLRVGRKEKHIPEHLALKAPKG